MASWTDRTVTNNHLLPYVDSKNAPPQWDVNEPVARLLGFGDEQLVLIRKGDLSSTALFTDRHRLVGEMVRELVEGNKVTEATMSRAQEMLGPNATMEVMIIHSVYGMLARIMQSAKIDFDPEIPGLLDMLRGYNARAIEEEKKYAEEDGIGFFPA
ncbi:hypothetical protein OF83DRAFT_1085733 [Amylostereum chailletii]|nr:hypothetical protein OF83DRAFT_1085733 [Amylostereum chailletii]